MWYILYHCALYYVACSVYKFLPTFCQNTRCQVYIAIALLNHCMHCQYLYDHQEASYGMQGNQPIRDMQSLWSFFSNLALGNWEWRRHLIVSLQTCHYSSLQHFSHFVSSYTLLMGNKYHSEVNWKWISIKFAPINLKKRSCVFYVHTT